MTELDVSVPWVFLLGIVCGVFAPFVFIIAVMSTDDPRSSSAPAYGIMGAGVAGIALIAWLVERPLQLFAGMALPFVFMIASIIVSNVKEFLLPDRDSVASPAPVPAPAPAVQAEAPEPIAARQGPRPQPTGRRPAIPPQQVRCRLVRNGNDVARFLDVQGLPGHADPRATGGPPPDAVSGGTLTFVNGSSANAAFVDWCRSGGDAGPGVQRTLEIEVEVLSERDVYAAITLHGATVARVELVAPQGDNKTTYIPALELRHAG